MIKLIVSDVDGTLAEDGAGSLNPELYEVILKLKKQGILFAGASGRHLASMEHVFEPVKDEIFYISGNGYFVKYDGKQMFLTNYPKEIAFQVVRDMRKAGLDVMIDGPECVYTDSKDDVFVSWLEDGYHCRVTRVDNLLELEDTILKVSGCRMSGMPEETVAFFTEKYGHELKVTLAGDQWLDTMEPGINKGSGLKLLQETLEILPEETIAFGDQLNDIEMLKQAYYSFAVANARPESKEAARFVADSNVNQGPLKIMKLFLK